MLAANGLTSLIKFVESKVEKGHEFRLLLNAQNSSGNTPLHWAIINNKGETAQALLDLGTDANLINEKGESLLSFIDTDRYTILPNTAGCFSAEDAVRVLDVSAGVANSAFVASPSVFNPLRVPVGPNPTELVVSDDGRVVAVLDPVGGVIRLIDAESLRVVRTASDAVYTFPLGVLGALPVSLEGDPSSEGCEAPCLGRFFANHSTIRRYRPA